MEVTVEAAAQGWSRIVVAAVTLVTLISLSFTLYSRSNISRARKGGAYRLPPGPRGWPVLGSLLSLGKLPHESLAKISRQYGPLMFMHLGSVPTLVVSSSKMAKEILQTHDQVMASRPEQIMTKYLTYDRQDIGFAPYGSHWRNLRKVCTLKLFTATRLSQFQGSRHREVTAMLHSIFEESLRGNALNMDVTLANLTTNVITQMMWNKSHCVAKGISSSAEASTFGYISRELFDLYGAVNIADYIPVLKPLSMRVQGFDKRMKALHQILDEFLDNIIDEHRKMESSAGLEGNMNEDFVDVLLKPSKQGEFEEPLPVDTIKAVLQDMISAGTDTSSTTLEWALAELLKHPHVMSRAQDELNSVIGPDRLVNEEDLPNLKYIEAVVKEVFRLHPAGPLSVPHESRHDCEIAGYHIPGGTLVFVNLWAIHRDAAVWERPLEFDPDRFLKSTVDVKGQDFELIPFGSGRRICPAMNLGLTVVRFTLAQILHAFEWSVPGDQELDMSEKFGLVCHMAVPLTVLAKPRLPAHVIYHTSL